MEKKCVTNSYIKEIFTLKQANQNILMIFDLDLDQVLIITTLEYDFRHPYRIKMLENISKQLTSRKLEILKSIICAQREVKLLVPDLNKLFVLIRSMKIPNIVLASMGTGKFGGY